jgi:hypothetical protein
VVDDRLDDLGLVDVDERAGHRPQQTGLEQLLVTDRVDRDHVLAVGVHVLLGGQHPVALHHVVGAGGVQLVPEPDVGGVALDVGGGDARGAGGELDRVAVVEVERRDDGVEVVDLLGRGSR